MNDLLKFQLRGVLDRNQYPGSIDRTLKRIVEAWPELLRRVRGAERTHDHRSGYPKSAGNMLAEILEFPSPDWRIRALQQRTWAGVGFLLVEAAAK